MANQKQTKITAESGKQELFIEREFDAPRELLFKAHTDPDLLVQWLGPNDLTMTIDRFEPVSGGRWRFIHQDADGNQFSFHGVHHEVLAPERIIQTFEFDGLPETGHVMLETAWFESLPNGRSRIRSQSVFQSVADRDGMIASGMESGLVEGYERLDALLATTPQAKTTVTTSGRELTMSRSFAAPRDLVWAAWHKPEYLEQWWGPKGWTLPVCNIDFRPSGTWQYCMRGPNGEESWGKATYIEIHEPEQIVYIDLFTDKDGNPVAGMPELKITVLFDEKNGTTEISTTTQFATAADLQSILEMGAVEGMTQTWDRLEAILGDLQS